MENKHIVLLTPGFAADESDDTCIPPLQVMLLEFKKQFPSVHFSIIALQYPFREDSYSWNGINVYPCNGRNKKSLARFFTWRKAMRIFKKLHREKTIDLIHSFWFTECAFLGERIHKRFGIPHVNTAMGQDALTGNKYLRVKSLQHVPVIALSERHAGDFRKNAGRDPLQIIPWGTTSFDFDSTWGKHDLLVVGSLIPVKRTEFAIDAMAELVKEFPQMKMTIIGEGEERDRLEKKVEQTGLQKNILFAGKVSREKVLNAMRLGKMLIHPSAYESFGYVFSEAMQAGIPIVSFAVGIAEEGPCWKIVKDKNEIATAVKEFLRNRPGCTRTSISVTATVAGYLRVYASLIERG